MTETIREAVTRAVRRLGVEADAESMAREIEPKVRDLEHPAIEARALAIEGLRKRQTAPEIDPEHGDLAIDLRRALSAVSPLHRRIFAMRFLDRAPMSAIGPKLESLRATVRAVERGLGRRAAVCPSDALLLGHIGNILNADEERELDAHSDCHLCKERREHFEGALRALQGNSASDCPSVEALVRGGTDVDGHLAECGECRIKVETIPPPPPARPQRAAIGLLSTAVMAFLLLFLPSSSVPVPAARVEEATGRLTLDGETAGDRIPSGGIVRAENALLRLPDGSELLLEDAVAVLYLASTPYHIEIGSGSLSFRAGSNVVLMTGSTVIQPSEVSTGRIEEDRVAFYRGSGAVAAAGVVRAVGADQVVILGEDEPGEAMPLLFRPPAVIARWPHTLEGLEHEDFEGVIPGGAPEDWGAGEAVQSGSNRIFRAGQPFLFGRIDGSRLVLQADVRPAEGMQILLGIQKQDGHAVVIDSKGVRVGRARVRERQGRLESQISALRRQGQPIELGAWHTMIVEVTASREGRRFRVRWWPLDAPRSVSEVEASDRRERDAFEEAACGFASTRESADVDNVWWSIR